MTEGKWLEQVPDERPGVTYGVYYTAGVIWELLQQRRQPVILRLSDQTDSTDICSGLKSVHKADLRRTIGGEMPSLIVEGSDGPIRAIEVVTDKSSLSRERKAQVEQLGVEWLTVQAPSSPDNIGSVLAKPVYLPALEEGYLTYTQVNYGPGMGKSTRSQGFAPAGLQVATFDGRSVQKQADASVADIIEALIHCSPQTRRSFRRLLELLDSYDALYTLRPTNPFFIDNER